MSRIMRGCVQSPGRVLLENITRRIAARWKAPWDLSWALCSLTISALRQGPNEGPADTANKKGWDGRVYWALRTSARSLEWSCRMGPGEMATNILGTSDGMPVLTPEGV
jgi:hypothetical protein